MAKSLQQTVAKYQANATGAEQAFVDGVNNTDVDPTALAIANQAGALSGYTAAITSGFWARQLQAVGKQGWQSATVAKRSNYSTGIQAGLPKYQAQMGVWLPIIDSIAQQAKAMPGGSLAQRLARANYVATALYNRKRGISG
jgi:hypothetical protein